MNSYALVHRSAPSGFDRPSSSSTVTYHQAQRYHQPTLYYRPTLYHQDSPHRHRRSSYHDQERLYHNNSQRRATTLTTATSRPMVYRDGTVSRYRTTVVTPKVYHHPQESSYRREGQRLYIDDGRLARYNRDADARYRERGELGYHDHRYVPRHSQQRYSRGYESGYGHYDRDSSYSRPLCCTIT